MSVAANKITGKQLPPYPKYKDSGVEWLGNVPMHWETWKVTHGYKCIGSGTTPKSDDVGYYDGDIPWVTTSELREAVITDTTKKVTSGALLHYSALKLYPKDSLLIAMYGATIGRLGILGIASTVNQACCVFSEPVKFNKKFVFYWLWMRRPTLISLSSGGGQPNLSQDDLRQLRIPIPPRKEQRAIAAFLDRETAKIDALSKKKQRMIALFQEKCTAIISHAVTKGLNPDAPMKDSGVEWLGKIPEHWEVKRFGFISRVVRGASPRPAGDPKYFHGDYVPWITVADITKDQCKYLTDTESMLTEEGELRSRRIPSGTLVLTNSGATLGVPKILKIGGCANDGVVAFLDISKEAIIDYLYFYLVSLTANFRERIKQGAGQPNLNTEIVRGTWVAFPPKSEQKEIVLWLDDETRKLEQLVAMVSTGIEKLNEYRTALISAAVTGKIDVRGEAA